MTRLKEDAHEENGHGTPTKKARKKREKKAPEEEAPEQHQADAVEPGKAGRTISRRDFRDAKFFVEPWFPLENLTMLIGKPGVGKGSFVAWLCARAKRVVLFPGCEESVEVMTGKRLVKNGVDLKKVLWMDDRYYTLPQDAKFLTSVIQRWGADLVVFDPIDSYKPAHVSQNGEEIRPFLESVFKLAQDTGACIIGVRHPAKKEANLLPGDRAWLAVPRSVVVLKAEGGKKKRRLIIHERDQFGQDAPPREYRLEGEKKKPKLFVLEGEVQGEDAELLETGRDPTDRFTIRVAARCIHEVFAKESRPLVDDLKELCKANGIGDGPRWSAMKLLGIIPGPDGQGGKWVMKRLAKEWPRWVLEAVEEFKGGVVG